MSKNVKLIAVLNDMMRLNFANSAYGRFMLTDGVAAYDPIAQLAICSLVTRYSDFTKDNDPYGEHDFGKFEFQGIKFFWKIDYYDKSMKYGSEDPSDPEITTRVLTVMRADEY